MKKVTERIDQGTVTLLVFPFDREEPIELGRGCFCYEHVTAALVRLKYSQNDVEAILCNHLLAPKDAQACKEFDELQAYRVECKREAQAIVEAYNRQSEKV
jgi:hypothetical protein